MRKQNLCIFIFQKLFIIAVTDNTTDCFVKGCLMLRLSKTVKKDKISISVYNSFTMNIKKLLSFFFHKECFFDEIQHRDLAFASRRFRGIDIKIAATLTTVGSMVIIYQRMITTEFQTAFYSLPFLFPPFLPKSNTAFQEIVQTQFS